MNLQQKFEEFVKVENARQDAEAFWIIEQGGEPESPILQAEDGDIVTYDYFAELFAQRFPHESGILTVEISGGRLSSVFIQNGKVIYSKECAFDVRGMRLEVEAEKTIEFLGVGQDGEALHLQKIHGGCWLLHAEGNSQSPFEFERESEARQLADMLGQFQFEKRLENLLDK